MKKQYYGIDNAIGDFIASHSGDDLSPTTIRCALNDLLDAADKNGCDVDFDYNQPRAISIILEHFGTRGRNYNFS